LCGEKLGRRFIRYLTSHLLQYVTSEEYVGEPVLIMNGFTPHWSVERALMDCAVTKKLNNPYYVLICDDLSVEVLFSE
jgi:hypothetical protein